MSIQQKELSVVIPTINNPVGIIRNINHLTSILSKNEITAEIILVDDLSDENLRIETMSKLDLLNPKIPVKLLLLSKNCGQFIATRYGIAFCEASFILTIDDDTLIEAESLLGLLDTMKMSQRDFLVGVQVEKTHRSLLRNFGSLLASLVAKFVYKTPSSHKFSSTIIFRAESILEIAKSAQYPTRAGWFYQITTLYDNYKVNVEKFSRTSNYNFFTLTKNFLILSRMVGQTTNGILAKVSFYAMILMTFFVFIFSQNISKAPSGYTSIFLLLTLAIFLLFLVTQQISLLATHLRSSRESLVSYRVIIYNDSK